MIDPIISKISPGIQHYAWGGTKFIPDWLGIENKADKPYAEAWYGDHPLAPAQLVDNQHTPLDQWISSNPTGVLGSESVEIYGPRMPFLLKILDVRNMLSLQLHPSKNGAIMGFSKENEMRIPLQAPNRNYKDQNHKPELLFALSNFWMLQGFATLEVIKTRFEALLPQFELSSNYSWRTLMDRIWALDSELYIGYLDTITHQIQSQNCGDKDDIYHWIEKALQSYPYASGSPDRGILVMMMMHVQYLKPGQVGYQAPGVLHAYLEGQNIELMANSDNVLRGGLTPKHIDPAELMLHLDTTSPGQCLLSPIYLMDDELAFSPPVYDFLLKYYPLKHGSTKTIQSNTVSVILVQKGKLVYNGAVLSDGESLIIPAFSILNIECISTHAAFFWATGSL